MAIFLPHYHGPNMSYPSPAVYYKRWELLNAVPLQRTFNSTVAASLEMWAVATISTCFPPDLGL
jgi:hypothetical protein